MGGVGIGISLSTSTQMDCHFLEIRCKKKKKVWMVAKLCMAEQGNEKCVVPEGAR